MNNYNEVKKSFGTQAEKFASYHMSKAEYTDYLIRSIQAKGNEHGPGGYYPGVRLPSA